MLEISRRDRQERNFTTNVPKILDLKSSHEQIFSENWLRITDDGKVTTESKNRQECPVRIICGVLPDSGFKAVDSRFLGLNSGFHHQQKFPEFRNPENLVLTWGEWYLSVSWKSVEARLFSFSYRLQICAMKGEEPMRGGTKQEQSPSKPRNHANGDAVQNYSPSKFPHNKSTLDNSPRK